jgi:hypothetical protein
MEYIFGVLTAAITYTLISLYADETPKELPMYDHCAKYEAELKSYDVFKFTCTNGATFDRDILEE